jgi:hypothetical protein
VRAEARAQVPEHGAQFTGDAGRAQHQAGADLQAEPGALPTGLCSSSQPSGSRACLRLASFRGSPRPAHQRQVRQRLRVLGEGNAGDLGDDLRREVVYRRSETAVDDHRIGLADQEREFPYQAPAIVAERDPPARRQAPGTELAGDQGGVRIDRVSTHQFITGEQELYIGGGGHVVAPSVAGTRGNIAQAASAADSIDAVIYTFAPLRSRAATLRERP